MINGIEADVVTLRWPMTSMRLLNGRIDKNWLKRLPDNSAPYTSTIVFLYAKATKQIHDWNDLIKPGVSVITPNPKSSGGALELSGGMGLRPAPEQWRPGEGARVRKALFKNVEVLDSGAGARLTPS